MMRILQILAAALFCLTGVTAVGQAPREVFFQTGPNTHFFTGDVGQFSSASIGISATQGLQFGIIGATLTIATDFHLTNQPPPPYARGLRTFTIATGIRIMPAGDLIRPIVSVEYANLGVVSNALIRHTGPRQHFNGIGASVGARLQLVAPFHVEALFHTRYLVDMQSPTFHLGGTIALGVTGGF